MQVKSIAEHSTILSTFIKLSFVIKVLDLSILNGRFRHVLLYMISSEAHLAYPIASEPPELLP